MCVAASCNNSSASASDAARSRTGKAGANFRIVTAGRAGALHTAGLASWVLGQFERAIDECAEAYRIAVELGTDRELCVFAFIRAIGLIGFDLEAGLRLTGEAIERSRKMHGLAKLSRPPAAKHDQ